MKLTITCTDKELEMANFLLKRAFEDATGISSKDKQQKDMKAAWRKQWEVSINDLKKAESFRNKLTEAIKK